MILKSKPRDLKVVTQSDLRYQLESVVNSSVFKRLRSRFET